MWTVIVWHAFIALVLNTFQKKSKNLLVTKIWWQNTGLWLSNVLILLHLIYWFYAQRQKSDRFYKLFFLASRVRKEWQSNSELFFGMKSQNMSELHVYSGVPNKRPSTGLIWHPSPSPLPPPARLLICISSKLRKFYLFT